MTDTIEINTSSLDLMRETLKKAQEEELAKIRADIRAAAVIYLNQGFRVIRLHGLSLTPAGQLICDCSKKSSCPTPGKHPNLPKGFHDRPIPNLGQIVAWWDEKPNSNIGLATGGDKGFVVDPDLPRSEGESNGLETWNTLVAQNGGVPETLVARTGSGGRHLWFKLPLGRSYSDSLIVNGIPKIDVKGERSLVVAPPSLHESGEQYRWLTETEPAEAPDWLFDRPTTSSEAALSPVKSSQGIKNLAQASAALTADVRLYAIELLDRIDPNSEIPKAMLSKIKWGVEEDRSEFLFGLCLEAIRRGIDPDHLLDELRKASNRAGDAIRDRHRRFRGNAGDNWFIDHVYFKALRVAASTLAEIDQFIEAADGYRWVDTTFIDPRNQRIGVRAKTLKLVMMESLSIARSTITTKPMLSKLMISKATGLTPKTVLRGLRCLEELGWISEGTREERNATIYELPASPPSEPS